MFEKNTNHKISVRNGPFGEFVVTEIDNIR